MRKFFLIFLTVIFISACGADMAIAQDSGSGLELPASPKVDKSDDLSLGVLTRLFGGSASVLIGEGTATGDNFFSGLITTVLGLLNLAAMVYVAAMIIYMWGVFAVTTAQSGEKLGGGVFNSLWIPVRHAMSFGLTIPIFNGLSLMQVVILLCVGLSINFANALWDFAGAELVKNTAISVSGAVYHAEQKSAEDMLPVMFKNSVIQLTILDMAKKDKRKNIWEKEYDSIDPENSQFEPLQEYPVNFDGKPDPDGRIIRIDDYKNGVTILEPRLPKNMRHGWLSVLLPKSSQPNPARIYLRFPRAAKNAGIQTDIQTLSRHMRLHREITEKKVTETLKLWRKMDQAAKIYLNSYASAGDYCSIALDGGGCLPKEEAKKYLREILAPAIQDYSKAIADHSAEISEKLQSDTGRREKLGRAIDSVDGKSRFGWITAGLFPFIYASEQQSINSVAHGQNSVYTGDTGDLAGQLRKELDESEDEALEGALNRNYRAGIRGAAKFFLENAYRSASYVSTVLAEKSKEESSSFSGLSDNLMAAFLGKPDGVKQTQTGILGAVLEEAATRDPVLVMQHFGDRLLKAAEPIAWGSAALSFVIRDWSLFFTVLILIAIAGFFAYVVPFVPVIFWAKALVSWIFMVIEAMVAAPFWVCAHALPEGSGFAGQHARRGYMMLLDIIARPVLLVLGVVFALVISQASAFLIYKLFNLWFVNVFGIQNVGVLADMCYALVVMSVLYYIFYTLFTKGVNYMPEHVLAWCGGMSPGGLRDEDQGTKLIVSSGGAMGSFKSLASQAQPKISLPGGKNNA